MSTRERAQMIFDQLTEEELAGFVALFEHRITAEPPVFPKNRAELNAMLVEAEEDIQAGRVYTEDEIAKYLSDL
ncbi:MAG: hypothetical protein K2N38_02660 [Oscillospiraceae bacterium]|nr:hypothetical protein [Oscillospiraceae bacterium]